MIRILVYSNSLYELSLRQKTYLTRAYHGELEEINDSGGSSTSPGDFLILH